VALIGGISALAIRTNSDSATKELSEQEPANFFIPPKNKKNWHHSKGG
jgi:hypothetical protein